MAQATWHQIMANAYEFCLLFLYGDSQNSRPTIAVSGPGNRTWSIFVLTVISIDRC